MHPQGHVDQSFRAVEEAFLQGFDQGRDIGASVAVMVDDDLVVDLWHGYRDRRRTQPWNEDTLVCMFSVTKAMTALCLLQAVDRGLVNLDEPVAAHWPEFASNGKDQITLRHLLTHQAGMVGFHDPVERDLLYDWDACASALAGETPWWEPGTRHGYHAMTFGFLLGELLRRASGRRVREWFETEVAAPLRLDFAIGLSGEDLQRCADVLPARIRSGDPSREAPGARRMMQDFNDLSTPTGAAFQNPALGAGYRNSTQFRQAELPAMNGHGTARSVARMYAGLPGLLSSDLLAEAVSTQSAGPDEVLKAVTHFGLGFMLYNDETPIGVRPNTFGHAGAGGSMACHDPETGVSFCFAMNQMELGVITGGRSARAIADAVYGCL